MYKNRVEFMPQDGHKIFLHRVTIWYLAVGCGVHIPATVSQPTLLASLAGNLHAYSFMQLVLSQHGRRSPVFTDRIQLVGKASRGSKAYSTLLAWIRAIWLPYFIRESGRQARWYHHIRVYCTSRSLKWIYRPVEITDWVCTKPEWLVSCSGI